MSAGEKVVIYVGVSVNYADKPGNLLQLKVEGFDGTVGSIERSVKALLEPALFHLKQVDEGKAP